MDTSDCNNISDILSAGGFPHLEVTARTRLLAHECIMTYEVITKRLPVLDDFRKGLKSEQHLGLDLLQVACLHEEVGKLIFPVACGRVLLKDLLQLVKFDLADDDEKQKAKEFMECYLQDLNVRGTILHFRF